MKWKQTFLNLRPPTLYSRSLSFLPAAMMELDHIPARSADARPRRKRSAPYIIYPEILVLVDYDGYLWVISGFLRCI